MRSLERLNRHGILAGIMIGQKLGRYAIIDKIGAGGWGDVYRARDERLDREVALKVLSAQALENETSRKRFRKEAMVLSRLNHPNIATILDFDTQEGVDFLVMEYISGTNLHNTLEKAQLSEKDVIQVAMQIATALDEAHSMGIVHRDLKPANVLLTPKGVVKVLDFGLAKLLHPPGNEPAAHLSTETNMVIGTVPYMSPEQLRTDSVDGRSDIYSFGVTLYEMATGRRPHVQTQPISLVDAILHEIPPPPVEIRKDLSPQLQHVILKCIEKDPENRYQSVKDLLVELRVLATPSMFTSAVDNSSRRPRRRMNSRNLKLGIAAAALIAIAATFYFANVFRSQPQLVSGKISAIVTLPSKVFGSEENQFLTDAVPNALSTHLSQIPGLETMAPPTNLEVERLGGDVIKLAQVYGVGALISSTVTADADRLILNVQLIEAPSRRLLWSRDYDGRRKDYPEVIRKAAEGLRTILDPSGSPIQSGAIETRSTDAELVFQRGYFHTRAYANLKQPEDFERALSDLQHALKLDPNNARAAAALARLYLAKFESGAPLREVLPEIDRWAYQALKLDHRCGEAWQVLSVAEEMRPSSDKRKRLEYALKAATYASQWGYSHHVLSAALSKSSFELAVTAAREGIRREPLHLNGLLFMSGILSRQDKPKEALQLIGQVLSMEPDMPMAVLMKVWLLLRDHNYLEAEKSFGLLEKNVAERRLHPGWADFARDWLNFEKGLGSGSKKQAAAGLQGLVIDARGESPPFPRWEIITGNVLGIQANHDSTEATMETFSIRVQKGIFEPYDWLILSPELAPVRKDPGFKNIAANSRTEFEEILTKFDQARDRKELPSYLEPELARLRQLL